MWEVEPDYVLRNFALSFKKKYNLHKKLIYYASSEYLRKLIAQVKNGVNIIEIIKDNKKNSLKN